MSNAAELAEYKRKLLEATNQSYEPVSATAHFTAKEVANFRRLLNSFGNMVADAGQAAEFVIGRWSSLQEFDDDHGVDAERTRRDGMGTAFRYLLALHATKVARQIAD
jgi:hypothetical protein